MTTPTFRYPDAIIQAQLHERLSKLESHFQSNALTFYGPLTEGADHLLRDAIEDMKTSQPKEQLTFILETNGGSIEVVQRIVETMRHHYKYVDVVIPNAAYSAGTVLAMSGDRIYMNYYSRLGPIDPQVTNDAGTMVPALGYLIAWNRYLEKAQAGTLTEAEALVMLQSFDHAEMYKYEQARELSITLLQKWLATYKFSNWNYTEGAGTKVTQQMKQERAAQIAQKLNDTERWHTHGHGISMEVLRNELNLRIDDYDDKVANPKLGNLIKDYYVLFENYLAASNPIAVLHHSDRYHPITP